MSQRLKNKHSPSSLAFAIDAAEKITLQIEGCGCHIQPALLALVKCHTTGKDQLAAFKHLVKQLKEKPNGETFLKEEISVLCCMFLLCVPRHPMRRSVSTVLENLQDESRSVALSLMSDMLQGILSNHKGTTSFDVLRCDVDTISALMENFPLGDEVIRENISALIVFLEGTLQCFIEASRTDMSPAEQTAVMLHLLTTLKTTVAVLQKCEPTKTVSEVAPETKTESETIIESTQGCVATTAAIMATTTTLPKTKESMLSISCILQYSFRILSTEYFTLECRCAAALVFPSILVHIPIRFSQFFTHLIHSGYKNLLSSPLKMRDDVDTGRVDVRLILCKPIEADIEMKAVLRELVLLNDHDDGEWNCVLSNLFDSICSFFDSEVEVSTRLVLLHAMLVKLPQDLLFLQLCLDKKETLFTEFFINELLTSTLEVTNKNLLVLGFKSITLWIEKAYEKVSRNPGHEYSRLTHKTRKEVLPHLVTYVAHYVDTVRHNVNTAIKLTFSLLALLKIPDFDAYVASHFTGVLTSRGHISMLINICQFVNVAKLLENHVGLPSNIVSILSDVDLASHGCDLYAAMCKKHFTELQDENNTKVWSNIWIDILYGKLNDPSSELKSNIANFLIPSILKINPVIVLDILADIQTNPLFEKVRAIIVFLRCLRGMKNYVNTTGVEFVSSLVTTCKTPSEDNIDISELRWKKLLRVCDLKKCLTHVDDQIRLDALSLICNSAKTTDPVDKEDMILIRHFLYFNMSCENPSFRHQLITSIKKIVLRLFNHAFQLVKQTFSALDGDTVLQNKALQLYTNFLEELLRFLFTHLYECAPYSQTSTALGLLDLISELMSSHADSELMKRCSFSEEEKIRFTTILMRSFNDTYEPNRVIAINTFKRFPCFCSFVHQDYKKVFLEHMEELNSPKPDVSSIAAYYILFLAVVLDNNDAAMLYDSAFTTNISELYFKETCLATNPGVVLLDILLQNLKKQLQVAKVNLIGACQDAPLYGVLYCMRLLLQFLTTFAVSTEGAFGAFPSFRRDLIRTGLEIIKVVSPYVSNEAPEGYLCDVSLLEIFNLLQLGETSTTPQRNIEVEAHVARMLLVCCWRSMKEVSLMLGLIVSSFVGPIDHTESTTVTDNEDSISNQDVDISEGTGVIEQSKTLHPSNYIMEIWDMFCDILLRSKHAGAYELASLGFIKLCSVLWSSHSETLRRVPANAVRSLINDLTEPNPYDNAQVTRRSAGVPFYLEALCTTEPPIQDKQSFKSLMTSLTELCENKLLQHDVNKIVISLNILRAFYKNGKLGEDVFPFVSSGVVIAIQGFGSSKWAVRNSCTLLFSALLQRIFGVKKCKMTGREFFSRFPRLYSYLLDQAKLITDALKCDQGQLNVSSYHPSLFPVLLLLTHLYPSTVETTNFLMRLDNFVPYVMQCGSSAVYKTRTIAARALVPLVSLENVQQLLFDLLKRITSLLPPGNGKGKRRTDVQKHYNTTHGSLLQFQFVIKRCFEHPKHCTELENLFSRLVDIKHLLFDRVESDILKSVYLDILTMFLQNGFLAEDHTILEACLDSVIKTLSPPCHSEHMVSPGYPIFLRTAIHYVEVLFQFTPESQYPFLEKRITEHIMSVKSDIGTVGEDFSAASFDDILVLLISSIDDNVVFGVLNIMEKFVNMGRTPTKFSEVTFSHLLSKSITEKCYPKVLSLFTLLLRKDEYAYKYAPLIVEKNLEEMSESVNGEARGAIVKFLASFILQLDQRQEVSEELSYLLDSSWQFIEESSKPDQCEACREEAVAILNLDPEESIVFISSPNTVYRYFTCAIKLLKDPATHIRDSAAGTLNRTFSCDDVSTTDAMYVAQPSFVLSCLFNTRILSQLEQDPKQCILYLVALMLDIDLDKLHDWLEEDDAFAENLGMSTELTTCPLMQRFVVYEESKENPYYDLKEIWELSTGVLEQMHLQRPHLHEVYVMTINSVQPYYDCIMKQRESEGWTYSQNPQPSVFS